MTRFYPNWWLVADVRHPFFASARPLVFAHRGGSGLAPENTIAAFDTALALGADGLELDVRLSKDGVVVVHHDASLGRTTDVRGDVSALTAAELAERLAVCEETIYAWLRAFALDRDRAGSRAAGRGPRARESDAGGIRRDRR
jgi:glycerophosphoryl diester phosphodiesterase